jgi:hypothetical protein
MFDGNKHVAFVVSRVWDWIVAVLAVILYYRNLFGFDASTGEFLHPLVEYATGAPAAIISNDSMRQSYLSVVLFRSAR